MKLAPGFAYWQSSTDVQSLVGGVCGVTVNYYINYDNITSCLHESKLTLHVIECTKFNWGIMCRYVK